MKKQHCFEAIIVGGSYAGLSAAMALGRSLRETLVIDSGKPCNQQTPYSHNFITHDGVPPAMISEKARQQVLQYDTVTLEQGLVTKVAPQGNDFQVKLENDVVYYGKKLLFATGVRDIMPSIKGFAACWGISVLHCPYCHGYEVRNAKTGILANGEAAFEACKLIRHWTDNLSLFTNGKAELTEEQTQLIHKLGIEIIEKEVSELTHVNGQLKSIVFRDTTDLEVEAIYARPAFEQHCKIPVELGCKLTEHGHLDVDFLGKTSVQGIFAAGDNTTPMRSVSVAVAAGTKAGAMINLELINDAL
ncbi:NAD(P)/FAD-dependent oxidoreductase [Sinomicrobium weinanense]|uniref:NAD(P)/FAD-dependent oxidoreductase n=1 Tax=Sinomicrobium weinanense TaxID=2842200 RepID=A0A926JT96_9FLAO|nr:NAD(P)/FAD-dependent oxidoreductase [Sinomicrobium weinanense]MBC9797090.1 NAD(P)/FAD-dependent oxidoreductase [Sinomicrobium weinanense]MBU3122681.1 NAD(P)/FAD-dependent oxidoreductase [Sinomicrobium weinanense]